MIGHFGLMVVALIVGIQPGFAQVMVSTTNMTDPSNANPDPSGSIGPARIRAAALFKALTGVQIPIDDQRIKDMEVKIKTGDERSAIQIASADALFYDVRVRDIARKMSTRAETITAPLSDFVATFVGVVRDSDSTSARLLLTGNFTYQGDPTPGKADGVPMDENSLYSSNAHYDFIQSNGFSLMKILKRVDGQKVYGANSGDTDNENASVTPGALIPHPDPAGLLTTRAFQLAHAVAGTNRRMVEYTFREFMCQPISNWMDTGVPDNFIGRDVDRAPSGDHGRFLNTCKGCHGQMDGLRPAFVHVDFIPSDNSPSEGKQIYNSGVSPKYARNQATNNSYNVVRSDFATSPGVNTPIGYRVQDNNWVNYLTGTHNMDLFGWRTTNAGSGVGQLGQMLASSQGFSRCLVKRVFSSICRRDPATSEDALIRKLADDFESDNYHLRHLFESVALRPECVGL